MARPAQRLRASRVCASGGPAPNLRCASHVAQSHLMGAGGLERSYAHLRKPMAWRGPTVTANGTGVVSHAGVGLLRELAVVAGLIGGVTAALADTYLGIPVRGPGRVFADGRWRSPKAWTRSAASRCAPTGPTCSVRSRRSRPRGGVWTGSMTHTCPRRSARNRVRGRGSPGTHRRAGDRCHHRALVEGARRRLEAHDVRHEVGDTEVFSVGAPLRRP
jgi:hypothetical protein